MLSTPRSGPQGGCVWKGGSWGRGEEGGAGWDVGEEPPPTFPGPDPSPWGPWYLAGDESRAFLLS